MDDNRIFFADSATGQAITYGQLVSDVAATTAVERFCKHLDYYEVLKSIVVSMLAGQPLTLLDGELTEAEVEALVGDDMPLVGTTTPINLKHITTSDQLLEALRTTPDAWRVVLYTSGTTGRPKQVAHTYGTITRNVRCSERHASHVWGFAYNPTHMAGLQVFFQALLNGNPIVRLFGLPKDEILRQIGEHGVTHISATPTFYRLLLPCDDIFTSVERITSGGEKFDPHTLEQLQHCFPNAKFTNVYASTEAGTLFSSRGNEFVLKPQMQQLVKVVDDELLIHHSLLGDSSSFTLTPDGWFRTGDLVDVIAPEPLTIRFKSRKSEMINVGGYKVSPTEVEDTIRLMPQVQDVRVYAKDNRILGKIICCEIALVPGADAAEKDVREFLQTKLQEYKIPRLYKFVDHLSVTHTGKLSRQ